jgi:acyl-coenzyme A synthetase/AMP-(fatty) acid ligase/acyl carrier protein
MRLADMLPLDHGGPVDHPFEPFPKAAVAGTICQRFTAIARRHADRCAVDDGTTQLTYAALAAHVAALAGAVTAAVADRPGPVAILLPADARFPAAMLGVLAAGRACVSFDADLPLDRHLRVITLAGTAAVVTTADLRALLPPDLPAIDADAPGDFAAPATPADADAIAAILLTSGSTGEPKGVAVSHANLLHRVWTYVEAIHLAATDRLSLLNSPGVTAAGTDIFGALLNGAALHVLRPRELGHDGLVREIAARRITICHAVPGLTRGIAEAVPSGRRLDSVRLLRLGGDRTSWADVEECRRAFAPDVAIYTPYNSTEGSTPSLHWFIDDALRPTTLRPPAGRPHHDVRVTIERDDGSPAADGEVGEIVVASRFVAQGYWDGAGQAVRPFAADPADPAARRIRSGDRGFRRPDGLFEFVGRIEGRVKLHGYRVDPAEVENVLAGLPPVADAAVLVRRDAGGAERALIAYATLRPGIAGLMPRHLQAMLAQRLPPHMVPARIVIRDELPRLANFKLDRRALAAVDAADVQAPVDGLASEVAEVFRVTLRVPVVGADDNVATLGGDSLQEMSVMVALERHFGVTLPPTFIETRPTIGEIAGWLMAQPHRRVASAAPA